jgi:putative ABC transport system permease protein
LNAFSQDLRFAWRMLARNPRLTLTAVTVLALALGANIVIFCVIQSVLLTPLRYPHSERLLAISGEVPELGLRRLHLSAPEVAELRRLARSYSDLGAYMTSAVAVISPDQPLDVTAAEVTASLLRTLGARAELGSLFQPSHEIANSEPVVVLSNGFWRRAFAADRGVLGRRVQVDGSERTVIGVMAPGLTLPNQTVEVWLPLVARPVTPRERTRHVVSVVALLRPGNTLAQARADMVSILDRWPRELPDAHTPNLKEHPLAVEPLLETVVGDVRPALQILWAAVLLVLVIACANISSLLLARAEARQQEVAMRTALGASRARLLRQFLTESLLLGLAGGLLGLLLAYWGLRAVVLASPDGLPRLDEIHFDVRTVLYTCALTVLTGLLVGLAPAWHARERRLFGALKEGARSGGGNSPRQWLRRALAVAELAITCLLVVSGSLLFRSFASLERVDPGFRPAGVLSARLSLPQGTYGEPERVRALGKRLLRELDSIPGVSSAAAMKGLPLRRYMDGNGVEIEDRPSGPEGPPANVDYWQIVTPDYFKVLGIGLVAGRLFTPADGENAPGVVLVSQTMAQAFWPGTSPLGRRLRSAVGSGRPWLTVVGVVRDVEQRDLRAKPGTELYIPLDQAPESVGKTLRTVTIALRTDLPPASLSAILRDRVGRIDPALPVSEVESLDQVVDVALARPRLVLMLVMAFALLALILAASGIYGVLSYSVEQRRHEIGVRMALGAEPRQVLALIMGQGAWLLVMGLAIGLGLTLATGRLLAHLLFGVGPTDPISVAGGVGRLLLFGSTRDAGGAADRAAAAMSRGRRQRR